MALSTTQSIWRSGGGDQTRTAYCGSGVMVATFYVADASVASATPVKVSSASNAANLVLPAGAVVLSISVTDTGTGHIDLGTAGSTASIASNLLVTGGTTAIGTVVTGTPLTSLSTVTAIINTDGSGTVGGYLMYYVVDPLSGQQNV